MNKLIIIDDINCKNDLEQFLNKHASHVKMVIDEDDVNVKVNVLLDSLVEIQKSSFKISVESSDRVRFIEVEKIVKLEKLKSYNTIFLNNGNIIISLDDFEKLEKSLEPYKIIKISGNLLLNLKYISKINLSGEKYIETEFDEKIPLEDSILNQLINMF